MKQLLIIASRVLAAASKELENIANEVPTEDKPAKRGPGRPPKEKPAEPEPTPEPEAPSAPEPPMAMPESPIPPDRLIPASPNTELSFIDLKNHITPLTKGPEAVKLKDYLKEKGAESLAKLSPLHYQGLWDLATELKK